MSISLQVTVKETEPSTVAFIAMKGPYTQIPEAFGRLYGWIGQRGYVPSGPPSGVYFNAPGNTAQEDLIWEVQSPIAGGVAVTAQDEQGLGVKKMSPYLAAIAVHKGPYEEFGSVYEALTAWITTNGYETVGPVEEVYLTDPMKTAPQDLMTEIRFPVRKAG